MTEEIWKPLCIEHLRLKGYEVSNLGNIRKHHLLLKGDIHKGRRCITRMNETGISKKKYMIHHLVWDTFNPENPRGDCDIDHMNGDKTDDRLENLQKLSHHSNSQKGRKNWEQYCEYIKDIHEKKQSFLHETSHGTLQCKCGYEFKQMSKDCHIKQHFLLNKRHQIYMMGRESVTPA